MKALYKIIGLVTLFFTIIISSVLAEEVIVGDELNDEIPQLIEQAPPPTQPVSPEVEPSGIRIGEERPAAPPPVRTTTRGGLQLDVSGAQTHYQIGESISFYVHGNREFFLWAYARDKHGTAVLLVPSRAQPGNKYPAGRRFRVPNKGLNFYADSPGVHDIILIASPRWLNLKNWLSRHARKQSGFWSADSLALETEFEAQGIRIDSQSPQSSHDNRDDVLVHRLTFDVR